MAYDIIPHFIGGQRQILNHNRTHTIYNPALGEAIAEIHIADEAVCDLAIAQAKQALETWSESTAVKRTQILFKFRELLEKNQTELARLVIREHGKSLEDAKGSVARAIEVVAYHCGLLMQLQGTYSGNISSHIDCYTQRQSLGVCAGVSPFNFPVMVPIWMMIPAIACGNAFILKPSEQDPSPALRLFDLLHDAGLPAGVATCLQGDKTTVDYLLQHPDIVAMTAVASTPVAKHIFTTATANGKRAHTFGGAKNHCVVMPDADFEQCAQAIVGAAFGSAGERCMAISVVVTVGDECADQLLPILVPSIKKIRVDVGDAAVCDMGPLISQAHRQRVIAAIDKGISEGAQLLIDGRGFKHPTHQNGYFLGPSLFDHVDVSMSIYQQEIFGPVLVIVRCKTFEEALDCVNQNPYGNGTAIFTRDGYTAREYSQRVQVGMVGINVPIPVPIANHSFGGWKQSSFGDTGMHGLESIHFYTKLKTITSRWLSKSDRENAFIMPRNG
jgi:malonate-semialdehyde dehydrogenase (acetylating)/methylmalonate-semialdehyde dehydrogenase